MSKQQLPDGALEKIEELEADFRELYGLVAKLETKYDRKITLTVEPTEWHT